MMMMMMMMMNEGKSALLREGMDNHQSLTR